MAGVGRVSEEARDVSEIAEGEREANGEGKGQEEEGGEEAKGKRARARAGLGAEDWLQEGWQRAMVGKSWREIKPGMGWGGVRLWLLCKQASLGLLPVVALTVSVATSVSLAAASMASSSLVAWALSTPPPAPEKLSRHWHSLRGTCCRQSG